MNSISETDRAWMWGFLGISNITESNSDVYMSICNSHSCASDSFATTNSNSLCSQMNVQSRNSYSVIEFPMIVICYVMYQLYYWSKLWEHIRSCLQSNNILEEKSIMGRKFYDFHTLKRLRSWNIFIPKNLNFDTFWNSKILLLLLRCRTAYFRASASVHPSDKLSPPPAVLSYLICSKPVNTNFGEIIIYIIFPCEFWRSSCHF